MRGALLVACLLASCGGDVQESAEHSGGAAGGGAAGSGSATGGAGATGGASGGGGGGNGAAGSGGAGGASDGGSTAVDAGTSCAEIAASIAKQTQLVGSCTAVVRLRRTTLALLAHQFVCGKYAATDETKARATATADSGFGSGQLIGGPTPPDEWVFYQAPTDFGGVAAVSARTGLSVFGAGIVWAGMGQITWPKTWLGAPLGEDCTPLPTPKARGFLVGEGTKPLAPNEVDQVLQRIGTTALPAGLAQWGYLFDAVVLAYQPQAGFTVPNPELDEYVVLLNSGWLE